MNYNPKAENALEKLMQTQYASIQPFDQLGSQRVVNYSTMCCLAGLVPQSQGETQAVDMSLNNFILEEENNKYFVAHPTYRFELSNETVEEPLVEALEFVTPWSRSMKSFAFEEKVEREKLLFYGK